MSKDTEPAPDPNARHEVPDQKKAAAKKWFEQARKLVDQRNYDYAIKSFVEGLSLDPLAVEEGFKHLRGCAVARWQTGGKKPSMMDAKVKYAMTAKDPVKGMVNAAWLLAHDPTNISYAEGLFKNADKARCDDVVFWIGPILRELLGGEKKPDAKKFAVMKDVYERVGDRCQARGEIDLAVAAYEAGIEALSTQRDIDSKNRDLEVVIRGLSTKLTILKGNYQTAESFRDSVRDSESQTAMHDEDRLVQTADRMEELIERAKVAMEANPEVEAKVITYVDLLCKDETDQHEKQAIELLAEKFKVTDNYRFKLRADDIAMRQLGRQARLAKKKGDTDRYKDIALRKLAFEEAAYRERVTKYPTDLRLKYEYARRLFLLRRFDDAIPLFQQARTEPKVRYSAQLYLGRCFFEKGFYSQTVPILTQAIEGREITEDDVAKELNYWLARALEADGKTEEAKQAYGKLLQIDYNYRDVRDR